MSYDGTVIHVHCHSNASFFSKSGSAVSLLRPFIVANATMDLTCDLEPAATVAMVVVSHGKLTALMASTREPQLTMPLPHTKCTAGIGVV